MIITKFDMCYDNSSFLINSFTAKAVIANMLGSQFSMLHASGREW